MKIWQKTLASIAAATVLVLGSVTSQANAAAVRGVGGCTALGAKANYGSWGWTKAWSNNCAGNVQARVMRYHQYSPTSSYGPRLRYSYVERHGGTGAGHALRIQISAGSGSWTDWRYF